nr:MULTISPECIES: hypothetical protein [Streptomyces]
MHGNERAEEVRRLVAVSASDGTDRAGLPPKIDVQPRYEKVSLTHDM